MTAGHAIGAVTALAGAAMALAPTRLLRVLGAADDGLSTGWVRLLGGRYVAQGAAELAHPSQRILWGACGADALHAATMLWAVAAGVPYRRAANASTAFATASATALATTARHRSTGRRKRPGRD